MLARYGSLRAGRLMWSGVDGAVQACAEDAGPSVHKPTSTASAIGTRASVRTKNTNAAMVASHLQTPVKVRPNVLVAEAVVDHAQQGCRHGEEDDHRRRQDSGVNGGAKP